MPESLLRRLCRLYRILLYAYPADFRREFGNDMTQVFADRCRAIAQREGLIGALTFSLHCAADWLASVFREHATFLKVSADATPAPLHTADGVPVFYTCDDETPRPGALMNGFVLSVAVFALISFLIGHGGSHTFFLIGSHHPSRFHLFAAPTSAIPDRELSAEVSVKPEPDQPPVSLYFKLLPVLQALDTDHDGILSAAEIANSPAVLRKLDKDGDGSLSPEECGLHLDFTSPQFLQRARFTYMRLHPVLAALDADHDGVISALEIRHAPAALWTLDEDGDRRLTINEVVPDAVSSEVARVLSLLDTDGDGQISKEESWSVIGQRFRGLLKRADTNKNGIVSEEELTNEIRRGLLVHP